jgi:hypothetical protein
MLDFDIEDIKLETHGSNVDIEESFNNVSESKGLRDLFILFRRRGDEQSAAELWNGKIRKNFIVKPV